jgi:hypothetical protein
MVFDEKRMEMEGGVVWLLLIRKGVKITLLMAAVSKEETAELVR